MNFALSKLGDLLKRARTLSRWKVLDGVILVLALVMVLYHFLYCQLILQSSVTHANTHLGFGLVICFLVMMREKHKLWPLMLPLVLLAIISVGYVQYFYLDLAYRISFNTYLDLAIGIILIILSIIACKHASGLVLPVLAGLFILYAFFGYLIPGIFRSVHMDWELIISRLALSFGISGIYGYLLSISATLIFLFMVFAMLIKATGAVDFFSMVGDWVSHRFRSGPAMAAVVTSSLVGSVSGLPGPNVMITGSFTIPAMKKVGYTPEQAGGIESAASTAGPIVPPVMGIVAFVMVGVTGIAYRDIVMVAFLPALLYIVSVGLYVTFQAGKLGIRQAEKVEVDKRELLLRSPVFFGPLIVLAVLLVQGYSAMLAAFWGTIALVVISLIRPKTRPSLSAFLKGLREGAEIGSRVAAMCAVLGIIVVVTTMTGLGIRLPNIAAHLCGDNLPLLLIFAFAACIVLGMGVPTSAAYILVAITAAPILLNLGIPLLQAHFFILYAAVFANITPPVAIPAIFAAQIAGGQYMKTAIQAAMAGMAGFVLPFMIIFVPSLMLDFSSSSLFTSIAALIACPLIFLGLQASLVGYFAKRLNLLERMFIILSPAALVLHIYTANFVWFAVGLAILVVFILWQIGIMRRQRQNLDIERTTN